MFYLLAVSCDDIALANFLVIVKRALKLIQIFGPIICIIALILNFTKFTINPEDKKSTKTIVNIVLALLITFFVPVIVDATMSLIGESTNFSSCWKSAADVINNGNKTNIVDDDSGDRTPLIDSSKYEDNKVTDNSDDNSTNNTSDQEAPVSSGIVLIGDSRVVQTYEYLSSDWGEHANYSGGGAHTYDSTVFIGEGSMGINWLKNTGISAAKSYFNAGNSIVIMLGVNDVSTMNIANTYASYINNNVDSWTANGSKVYFAAITPCNGNYSSLNSAIDSFNSELQKSLSSKVGWIDTDVYIKSQGYQTVDGLHYNQDTCLKIYNYIKSKV